MSLSLVALKIFAPAIAKTLLESFHIETKLLNAVLEEVIDNTSEGVLSSVEAKKANIDQIAKQLANDIKPLFEREAQNLQRETKNAIVISVAETLIKARLSADTLAEMNFDEERLKDYLLVVYPEVLIGFSDNAKSLYRQVVDLASKRLIASAAQMQGFALSAAAVTLQRLDEVLRQLAIARELANQAADAYAKNYRRKVQEKLDKLEVFGLDRIDSLSRQQSLSMAYINLSANCPHDEDEDEKSPLMLMGDDRLEHELGNRSRRVDEAIYNCRRLVIRGSAGAGKSTLLQWIAVRAATQTFPENLHHWNCKIPFFIRLRDLVDEKVSVSGEVAKLEFPTPEEFTKFIAKNYADEMPKSWVHQYLKRGQALVLIDGVDELPRLQRQDFFEALKDLVSDFEEATFIVTSRPSGLKNMQGDEWEEWEEWVRSNGFATWTLEPMSIANIEEFVKRWHESLSPHRDEDLTQLATNLKTQLRQRPELRRLAATPLLCAMICALHRDRQENLPNARLVLYRDCIDMLLNRRDRGRRIPLDDTYPLGLDEEEKIELLQGLALKLMRLNLSTLEAERVDRHFQGELSKTRLSKNITGRQIRDLFVDRSGLLREPSVNQIDFAHRTFQEYLAGKEALADESLEELLGRATDDQWRETIILTAGLARPKERGMLLDSLINRGNSEPDKQQYLHLLAVACLETATTVDPAIREKVLSCAKAILPPKDDDEVPMFAAVGNEIIPLLKYESHYSAEEACRCINVLVQIGNSAAMLMLVDYAKARFQDDYDNYLIGQEISEGFDVFEQSAYISEVLTQVSFLMLSNPQVTDLSFLRELTQLNFLMLSNTQVTDVSPLRELTQLNILMLSNTQVTDLSPLRDLTQLKDLLLGNTQVTDLSSLSVMTQLKSLYLNHMQVTDLSSLRDLTQLNRLDLSNTQVTDLSPLRDLTQLNHLDLRNTQVTDLSSLSVMTQLKSLYLNHMQVTDLSSLRDLTQLNRLDLSNTQVTDLSPLRDLTQLNHLDLRNTQVTDLSPLSVLTQLNRLDLSYTQVTDLSPLSVLTQLNRLDLSYTQVTDLSPLSVLTQLKELYLSYTQITEVLPLKNLTNLTIYTGSREKIDLWKSQGLKVEDDYSDIPF
ncbi:leucine-rich repeat domain-containing protein [Pseudanabaena yagii]|uniref:NACHT domain-containing protein n=1 Tax=Pseudanabaena yagii GIHE-NHR1 TaxID=2722753 RepID=A0ABX1LNA8_9CYAN|nr:leucine-rich repeat domain-containing protein [Pseudanabaena yagii]NMF56773.1 NACHT domain-containing protein [Pseudanabaena yagii GIHE-NHR1]